MANYKAENGLLERARKPSHKVAGLPRCRHCLAWGEERMIVARDLCDKCRKKEERLEAGMNFPAFGNKQTKEGGMKILAKLLDLMSKAKLLRANRQRVLQEFMPFLGVSPDTQRTLIREMTGPGVEETESPFARVHAGSKMTPDASDGGAVAAEAPEVGRWMSKMMQGESMNTTTNEEGTTATMPKHDLTEHWQEMLAEGGCIAIMWSIQDVKTMRPDLTDSQCMEVLDAVENNHDATLGVAWDTLEFWAEEFFPPTPETQALLEKIESLDLNFGEFAKRCRPNETAEQTIARIEAEDAAEINPA